MDTASSVREFLFTLLLKVAVASSFAALLARWNTFRRVLFTEQRDPDLAQCGLHVRRRELAFTAQIFEYPL